MNLLSLSSSPQRITPKMQIVNLLKSMRKKRKKFNLLNGVKKTFSTGADAIGKVGARIASKFEETFRNKSLMKQQMLFYGVVSLYNDGLEKFMNM